MGKNFSEGFFDLEQNKQFSKCISNLATVKIYCSKTEERSKKLNVRKQISTVQVKNKLVSAKKT